jgi:hypothetical protein
LGLCIGTETQRSPSQQPAQLVALHIALVLEHV